MEPLQTAFVFPGQGSQTYSMARALFDGHATFRRAMLHLDAIFADLIGRSIVESLYDGRRRAGEALDDVLLAHPATFAVQYAMGRALIEHGVTPAVLVGASLGELTAATLGGALPVEQAAAVVAARARVFDRSGLAGGMIAILHHPGLHRELDVLGRESEIAGINYNENFVVAGLDPGLERIQQALRTRGISFQRLAVRQPFHSSLIDHLRSDVVGACALAGASAPTCRVVSCTAAGPLHQVDGEAVWHALRRQIRIRDAVRDLEAEGSFNYIDLGPGSSFSNSIKRILAAGSRSRIHQPLTPFARGCDAFDRTVEALAPAPDRGGARARSGEPPVVPQRLDPRPAARNRRDTAYLFPGQGSQLAGMGAALFDRFRELTERADEVLGYSIRTLCTRDPHRQLGQTQFTQPALYVVNALTWFAKLEDDATLPAFVAGHSLGEYNALLAAGAFDFDVGLRLVKTRGELMSRVSGGAMAAVVGCDAEAVAEVIAQHELHTIDVANFNSPAQTVVSGPASDVRQAQAAFEARGARYVLLNVSAPFHSRYMEPVVRELEGELQRYQYSPLACPVISNVTARPYEEGSLVHNLSQQLRRPVQWTGTVAYLLMQGVQEFAELGPRRVLTNLVADITRAVVTVPR
ncbi:MAG: ACP S-malonyltransferase [Vicinamibacterales bacterium]